MPFNAGTILGSYEILGPLGAGGMGQVYRAHDTKLKRDVAIKLLPEAFALDADRVSRFQREAHVLASLNHPNIAAIYDFVENGNVRFIVIELVEGETLADRIRSGPLPVDEALTFAKQIAEALEAAHAKGVIHRDLKPANVKLTPEGSLKVLDFGLAKVLDPQSASGDFSNSPTMVSGTVAGVILGTAAYMSPEQARGQGADAQSDIWAFGCVLFEMLTGKQIFTGETLTDVLGGIVRGEPEWAELPKNTPPLIRLLLRQCLQKHRGARLHHIGDARIQIDAAMKEPELAGSAAPSATAAASRPYRQIGIGVLLFAIAAGLTFIAAGYFRPSASDIGTLRFLISPPEKASFNSAGGVNAPYSSISPDGRKVAFLADTPGIGNRIWIRSLDSVEAQPLPGTEGVAAYPIFWSPDGRYLGFGQQGNLKKIAVTGGPPQTICPASGYRSGSWNREGVIVFDPAGPGPLMRVADAGGKPEPVTALDASRQEQGHAWPFFLPDGDHFLFLSQSSLPGNDGIFVGALSSKKVTFVVNAQSRMAYDSAGFLLFVRERSLMAQPFDPKKLGVTGDAVPIAEQVRYNGLRTAEGQSSLSVSNNGVLVYRTGGNDGATQLIWTDRSGKIQDGPVGTAASYRNPELSWDDKWIAVERTDEPTTNQDIWMVDVRRAVPSKVTSDPENDVFPLFSPDGAQILFQRMGLFLKSANGTGTEEQLLSSDVRPLDWSRDNRYIVYTPDGFEIWALPLFGERKPFPFLDKPRAARAGAQFSPDGRWLAYRSNESGRAEVYVQSFPNSSVKFTISKDGGNSPRWCCEGKELFYVDAGKLWSVEMRMSGTTLVPSPPVPLFDIPRQGGSGGQARQQYDVTQDGKKFLFNAVNVEGPSDMPLTVVVNWSAALKK